MIRRNGSAYLLWLLLIVIWLHGDQVECCVEEERLALLELKAYMLTYSDHGEFIKPWSNNGEIYNCCAWSMVQCEPLTGHVTKLDLSSMVNFFDDDTDSPWLFNVTLFRAFKQLIGLDLSNNYINGLVENDGSSKISTMQKLRFLNLGSSNFESRGISVALLTSLKKLSLDGCGLSESNFQLKDLANMKELEVLNLSGNEFQGPVQELLTNFTIPEKLHVLDLGGNNFHGSISDLCNLKNLLELRLHNNLFYGGLPSCLRNLSSLQVFDLSSNDFNGKFIDMVLNFTSLQYLDLSDNYVEGKFSLNTFANFSNLEVLQLSRNNIEVQTEDISWSPTFQLRFLGLGACNLNEPNGSIPKFLLHQYKLEEIDLSENNLVGSFPSWLLNNTQLTTLYLKHNFLSGSLQLPHHSNASFLDILDISSNYLQGPLPENIGSLFLKLSFLNMSMNHFEGHIPTSTSYMTRLIMLDMSYNKLSGEIPKGLLSHCKALMVLRLSDNNLEGEIIPQHMNLPNLKWLQLSNNQFRGAITDGLRRSNRLFLLDISNNMVTGQIPRWIGEFFMLYILSVSQNIFQGQIPTEICKLLQLNYLDLSKNNFTGQIPSCSNFSLLNYVHLSSNSLTGPIPKALSTSSNLVILDLRDNQLSGRIPLWIDKLSRLQVLLLRRNNLHGLIPYEMCQLGDMNILDLSYNNLSGKIPACLGEMSFGAKLITQDNNKQTTRSNLHVYLYAIPEEVEFLQKNEYLSYVGGVLQLMSGLDLSCNNLTGVVPSELGDLTQIKSVNLSRNFLFGSIPSSFSNLKQVESLDLSYNNLTGMIPFQLVELNFLEIFNVSYNNLIGRVPETGQFASFDERNYLGNPGLYGFHESVPRSSVTKSWPPVDPTKEGEDDDTVYIVDFMWSFSMSCVIMFLATIIILRINHRWRTAWFEFVEWHILWWLPILYS